MLRLTLVALHPVDWNLIFFCAFLWHTACCESVLSAALPPTPPTHTSLTRPQESVEGTGLIVVNRLCCSMLVPEGNPPSVASLISSTHSSQNQCMCSVVVVAAMVAWSLQPIFFIAFSKTKYLVVWPYGCSLDHRILKQCHSSILYNPHFGKKMCFFYIYL